MRGTDVSDRGAVVPSHRAGDMSRIRKEIVRLLRVVWASPHALVCDVFWTIQSLPLYNFTTEEDILLAINSSEVGKNSKGRRTFRMALVYSESQLWVCLVHSGWYYTSPELFFGESETTEGDDSQGDGPGGRPGGFGQGQRLQQDPQGGKGPRTDQGSDPWQSWKGGSSYGSKRGASGTRSGHSGGGYGAGAGQRYSDGGFSQGRAKDGSYRGTRDWSRGAQDDHQADQWAERDPQPRQENLREKFQHTGPRQTRHPKMVGVHTDGRGQTYLWHIDALPLASGEPDFANPYLWWRQLGFDIPSWDTESLRRLYRDTFGGNYEGVVCSQRGRIPGCAAEAEHTNLCNRIHNANNARWGRHGGTSDDARGPKFARLSQEAPWPQDRPLPNNGGFLPENWLGEIDRKAGRVEQEDSDGDLSDDSGWSPMVIPKDADPAAATEEPTEAAEVERGQQVAPVATPEPAQGAASSSGAKKEEPMDAPMESPPGAAAPVELAATEGGTQAAAPSPPAAEMEVGTEPAEQAPETPRNRVGEEGNQ